MSLLVKLGLKQDWQLVKTREIDGEIEYIPAKDTFVTPEKQTGLAYVHCFESNKGNRKVKYTSTIRTLNQQDHDKLLTHIESTAFYINEIYPWLQGRRHADIPSYKEIDKEDFFNLLK